MGSSDASRPSVLTPNELKARLSRDPDDWVRYTLAGFAIGFATTILANNAWRSLSAPAIRLSGYFASADVIVLLGCVLGAAIWSMERSSLRESFMCTSDSHSRWSEKRLFGCLAVVGSAAVGWLFAFGVPPLLLSGDLPFPRIQAVLVAWVAIWPFWFIFSPVSWVTWRFYVTLGESSAFTLRKTRGDVEIRLADPDHRLRNALVLQETGPRSTHFYCRDKDAPLNLRKGEAAVIDFDSIVNAASSGEKRLKHDSAHLTRFGTIRLLFTASKDTGIFSRQSVHNVCENFKSPASGVEFFQKCFKAAIATLDPSCETILQELALQASHAESDFVGYTESQSIRCKYKDATTRLNYSFDSLYTSECKMRASAHIHGLFSAALTTLITDTKQTLQDVVITPAWTKSLKDAARLDGVSDNENVLLSACTFDLSIEENKESGTQSPSVAKLRQYEEEWKAAWKIYETEHNAAEGATAKEVKTFIHTYTEKVLDRSSHLASQFLDLVEFMNTDSPLALMERFKPIRDRIDGILKQGARVLPPA